MAKFKFFAILAALCLGLNLSASELDGRWSIVSVTAQGQTFKTAGQKCLEDSFIEASGDNARLSLSSAGGSSCEKAEQNFALKSLGGGRYSLGGAELRLNHGSLAYKQGTDSGEIVFTFKKDEVNLAGIVNGALNQASPGGSNLSEIEGRWELVLLKAQGQSFKVAGQKCFGDSFFEIGGKDLTHLRFSGRNRVAVHLGRVAMHEDVDRRIPNKVRRRHIRIAEAEIKDIFRTDLCRALLSELKNRANRGLFRPEHIHFL